MANRLHIETAGSDCIATMNQTNKTAENINGTKPP